MSPRRKYLIKKRKYNPSEKKSSSNQDITNKSSGASLPECYSSFLVNSSSANTEGSSTPRKISRRKMAKLLQPKYDSSPSNESCPTSNILPRNFSFSSSDFPSQNDHHQTSNISSQNNSPCSSNISPQHDSCSKPILSENHPCSSDSRSQNKPSFSPIFSLQNNSFSSTFFSQNSPRCFANVWSLSDPLCSTNIFLQKNCHSTCECCFLNSSSEISVSNLTSFERKRLHHQRKLLHAQLENIEALDEAISAIQNSSESNLYI